MTKWVYLFGADKTEGRTDMKNLLGGKGANLAEMASIGLPVPPGFTITTEVCTHYYDNDCTYPSDLDDQIIDAVKHLESALGMKFGSTENPLLLSVRSGARVSMPGMMDTVLNLGLNDETVEGLAKKTGNARFAYDSYRRFIQMYCSVVMDVDHHHFEKILADKKKEKGVDLDTELTADDLAAIIEDYKKTVIEHAGKPFPTDPQEQLKGSIGAVFGSWMNQRAITYRKLHNVPGGWGTAVNIQVMVFGNMGDDCATGVAFTRDPATGENAFYGEYLVNAQGEDVVAGIRTPQNLTVYGKERQHSDLPAMEEIMPEVFKELDDIRHKLEQHYKDIQDVEFTVQNNKLFMLQTRNGKRTTAAALKIAVDLCNEGLIDKAEAVRRIEPASLDQLLHPMLDPNAETHLLGKGLPASPGAASGKIVFNADEAEEMTLEGEKVLLCRVETSPEDIHGMHAAKGILTTRGGMTSHAAVVARGMGRCCVAGAGDLVIDYKTETLTAVDGTVFKKGDIITLDGTKGEVLQGAVPTIEPKLSDDFAKLMEWADDIRRMKVRANAETPKDAAKAREFGAEGIGLCRTEHMFFDAERIIVVREMILATDEDGRRKALDKLLPMQQKDFEELFEIMEGLPVTIRLLDPPLHEFLPHGEKEQEEVAAAIGVTLEKIKARIGQLHESNPMLGHRGCRLGVTYPEISEMQARAIFQAATKLKKDKNVDITPEVMIPLVALKGEFDVLKEVVIKVAKEVAVESGIEIDYQIGTMIELPRAALLAGEIAEGAEFFSFGTNDLTQTTFGLSRDDAGTFLPDYVEKGLCKNDPFVSIDQDGVGELVEIACKRGRKTRPAIKLGICGEHGGDPVSIEFCDKIGLTYVSCSPFRVPIARLAAAHATLAAEGEGRDIYRAA
ncbi:MAG: pyruvate, phosphate dikinase [Pseudomonadota bacterium]|nr:pyruvate, phosphate dikinase [Pseudomonadota bacterium]